MRKGMSDIFTVEHLASVLANEDDETQAKFFKSFIKECLSWETAYQVEQQLASVNLKLTKEERKVIGMLGFDE